MLPFSSVDFFFLFAGLLAIAFAIKKIASGCISYRTLLFCISLFYIIFFFPDLHHLAAYLIFSYGLYYSLEYVFVLKNKLAGSILLALPMIFVKALWWNDWISFAGLSYITFRVLQIYIDNDAEKQKPAHPVDYILFLIFPATLLIGPIDRFQRFKTDLQAGYANLNSENLLSGWQTMLYGILQKFVLAELVNRYWLEHTNAGSKEITDILNNMYAYTVYLYFDFAGYSSLAVGLGKMFGISVPINFNMPFLAVNAPDFWKRWHKSLGDWLGDYIFKPYYKWISTKQKLKNSPLLKQNTGLFLTFLIMGLWNGFKANFILSGCVFGLYSVLHNSYVFYCRKKGRDIFFGKLPASAVKWLSIFFMINLASAAIYIFSGRCPFIQ